MTNEFRKKVPKLTLQPVPAAAVGVEAELATARSRCEVKISFSGRNDAASIQSSG